MTSRHLVNRQKINHIIIWEGYELSMNAWVIMRNGTGGVQHIYMARFSFIFCRLEFLQMAVVSCWTAYDNKTWAADHLLFAATEKIVFSLSSGELYMYCPIGQVDSIPLWHQHTHWDRFSFHQQVLLGQTRVKLNLIDHRMMLIFCCRILRSFMLNLETPMDCTLPAADSNMGKKHSLHGRPRYI